MTGVPAGSLTVRIRVVAAEVAGARVPDGARCRGERVRARHKKATCLLQADGALELAWAVPRHLSEVAVEARPAHTGHPCEFLDRRLVGEVPYQVINNRTHLCDGALSDGVDEIAGI